METGRGGFQIQMVFHLLLSTSNMQHSDSLPIIPIEAIIRLSSKLAPMEDNWRR